MYDILDFLKNFSGLASLAGRPRRRTERGTPHPRWGGESGRYPRHLSSETDRVQSKTQEHMEGEERRISIGGLWRAMRPAAGGYKAFQEYGGGKWHDII